jgi:hypothetical protein
MSDSGLIAVSKVVERLGRTHRQRYWIKPSELHEMVRRGDVVKAIELVGGNGPRLSKLVSGWAKSTGTTDAAEMRAAAAHEVFLDKPALVQRELDRSMRAGMNALGRKEVDAPTEGIQAQSISQAFSRGLTSDTTRSDIAAMAAVAQSMYEQPNVVLWRGVRGNSSTCSHLYEEARTALQRDPNAEIPVETGVLSSFTSDPNIARAFSRAFAGGAPPEGFYFRVTVPRDSIVMSHRVPGFNPGQPEESEVTVLTAGSVRVRAKDFVAAIDPPTRSLGTVITESTPVAKKTEDELTADYLQHFAHKLKRG